MLGFLKKNRGAEGEHSDKAEKVERSAGGARPERGLDMGPLPPAGAGPRVGAAAGGRVEIKAEPKADKAAGAVAVVTRKISTIGFTRVVNFVLLALALVLPILFLPTSSEAREFNKQALLFFGVVVMLAAWVIRIITTRKVAWVKTSLDYILLAYLVIYFLASLFSVDRVSSFLGYYGQFTNGFLAMFAMILLYFLVVNHVRTEILARRITKYLIIGGGLVMIYSLLQLLGIYVLPLAAAQSRAFNPIGSMAGLSIFTALMLILLQWSWLTEQLGKRQRLVYGIMTAAGLLIMLLVNAFVGWIILTLGMIIFVALGLVITGNQPNIAANWFWKPMIVLVIGILFIAFHYLPNVINPRNLVNVRLPVEIQLSNATTWNMVKNSMSARPILGSGPGTTGIVFGDIKPESLNKTIVWQLNFDRASNEAAGIAIETGILGLLAFELTAVLFLFYGLFFLLRKGERPGRFYAFGFFTLWLTLYLTHFFYFFNTTFYFLYWLSLGMFMAIAHWNEGEENERSSSSLSFQSSPRATLSWMFASLLMLAALLVGGFFQAAVVAAEAAYASGIRQINQPRPDFAAVSNQFLRSAQLNPYRDVYYIAYGQSLIFRANEEAAKEQPNVQQIQAWVADLVAAGRAAVEVSDAKASNWSALAQFYSGIRPLVSNTDNAIVQAWTNAIERDPKNPALFLQRATAYVNASEYIDEQAIKGTTDTDQDGLGDANEQQLGSNPQLADSNTNGVKDGDEVKAGFNPGSAGRLSGAQLAAFTKVDAAKLSEAEKDLRRAMELKSDYPEAYINLVRVHEKAQRLTEARAQIDEAFRLFPGNVDVRFEQGRIAFNQRSFTEAETIFQDVVRVQPNHANAHYSLGLVYQQRGDNQRALASFERAREISGPNIALDQLINSLK